MGNVPPRGGSGNFRSEFHYPVMGRHGRKAPAPIWTTGSPGHLTEAESVPPGFTRTQRKTPEEQEAVAKYRIPSEASQKQSINKELGIQDVTTIDESWYPPTEAEVASAVESILDKSQHMDMDPAPPKHLYEMFQDDALELLGMAKGSDSPVTAREDRVLDTLARFSRAPGDGRPTPESST